MTTLESIEQAAQRYADAMRDLQTRMDALDKAMAQLKRRRMRRIRDLAATAADRKADLLAMVTSASTLFKRPRTRVFHGVKVGWTKGKGRIDWADPAQVVRLIRRHLADSAATLIKVKETPVKAAIGQLSAADLKRIGVTVIETGYQPVADLVDGDIEKLVNALLSADERPDDEGEGGGDGDASHA